jgi:D-cysteine desulfhydrase
VAPSFGAPTLPTPVEHVASLDSAGAELWLKNDGLAHALYGGNKVRKALRLFAEAERLGARRILTFGAAGSHHVLTLALFARAAGIRLGAVLIPQPYTEHAASTLGAALAAGLEPYPITHPALLPLAALRAFRPGDYVVPPGGSNVLGAAAYADAVDELLAQVAAGVAPLPDWIVVPLGSGGTAAGILAGVLRRGLPCRVLAVQVVPGFAPRAAVRWLARRVLAGDGAVPAREAARACIVFDADHVGQGYGFPTHEGDEATAVAQEHGLSLEPTYTAKAFAAALELLREPARHGSAPGRRVRVLYWHTFAANARAAALAGAPLLPELRRLFT